MTGIFIKKDCRRDIMNYTYGLKKGIPIALGYISVSFGFGISAVEKGIDPLFAVIISIVNLTSAGQMAGVTVMAAMGTVLEMILSQFVINLRYSLMGIALTQKLSKSFGFFKRLVASFGITDEIFVLASSESEEVTPSYMYGLMTFPVLGWALGTALGAFSGSFLPEQIKTCLGLAIYSMFVAIIVPPARDSKPVAGVICVSSILSCLIYYVPFLSKHISGGFSIIICALVSAGLFAKLCPLPQKEVAEDE